MVDDVIKVRKFLLRDAQGRNVDVTAQLGRHFSITSQNGAAHEQILGAATDDVRADLDALVAVHLADATGVPMHAIDNAAYHLRKGDIDASVRSLGSVVPPEALYPVLGEATRRAADPTLIDEYLKKPQAEAAKLVRIRRDVRDGTRMFASVKEQAKIVETICSLLGRRKVEDREIEAFACGRFDEPTRTRVAESLKVRAFYDAMASFVETNCRPIWAERAAAAMAALDRPDYLAEGRPPIDQDPTTFEGFIAKWGLEMETGPARVPTSEERWEQMPSSGRFWTLVVKGRASDRTLSIPYGKGNPTPPTLPEVLETLQGDFCSVLTYDRDEWLMEFGFNGDMKMLRRGEAAYDRMIEEQIPAFRELAGEDALRDLLTSVGDNPPIDREDYDAVAARAQGPRP